MRHKLSQRLFDHQNDPLMPASDMKQLSDAVSLRGVIEGFFLWRICEVRPQQGHKNVSIVHMASLLYRSKHLRLS